MMCRVAPLHRRKSDSVFGFRNSDFFRFSVFGFRFCPCSPMKSLIALIALLSLIPLSAALAVAPKLNSILPTGAQRGSEVEVRFNGQRLDDTKEIVLYANGISVVKMEAEKTNVVKATLKIAAD